MNDNILLVEDNVRFRQTLADTLLKHFLIMSIAEAGGEDALSAIPALEASTTLMAGSFLTSGSREF